jgi:hypothetical protein
MIYDSPRKLTKVEARIEQVLYWSKKSIPERLAAAMYQMRGIDIDERKTDLTPSRVSRRQS